MPLKEPFNSISHMVGSGLAIAALPLLVLAGAMAHLMFVLLYVL